MLTREENELVVNTNKGTPMGELFRRFWLPVSLASELPGPDCDPVRQRVLGEDLILFRDSSGRPGLVDAYCPHRGAPMFFGRNEENGLRCVYHGWKFDVEGACVDLPNAPEGETFKQKVRIDAYPCVEKGGLIWAFMGPKDKQPPFPAFEWCDLPKENVYVSKFRLECNYLQAMEGDYDPSHGMFLHTTLDQNQNSNPGNRFTNPITQNRQLPLNSIGKFGPVESESGLLFVGSRPLADGRQLVNASPWMMPIFCTAGIAGPDIFSSNMRIPIENESLMFYRLRWSHQPIPAKDIAEYSWGGYVYPEMIPGSWKSKDNVYNDYGIDRVAQRNFSYTGIKTFPLQDIAMMENQWGPIAERTKEHLTSSDVHIIGVRRKLIRTARALMEGTEPTEPWRPEAFAFHTASVVVSPDEDADAAVAQAIARAKEPGLSPRPLVVAQPVKV